MTCVGNCSVVVRMCVRMNCRSRILVPQRRPSPRLSMIWCCISSVALTEDVRFVSFRIILSVLLTETLLCGVYYFSFIVVLTAWFYVFKMASFYSFMCQWLIVLLSP